VMFFAVPSRGRWKIAFTQPTLLSLLLKQERLEAVGNDMGEDAAAVPGAEDDVVLATVDGVVVAVIRLAFSSRSSRRLAGHGFLARTRGADVLELPVLGSNHPGTWP